MKTIQISDYARAAKNMKRELSKRFPGVKFRARSESFSMGCSVDVSWELGPTEQAVNAIIKKYQYGSFDGMTDSYNYDQDPAGQKFRAKNGSAKYVHARRGYPREFRERIERDICALQGVEYAGANTNVYPGSGGYLDGQASQQAYRALAVTDFPAGFEYIGVEHNTAGSAAQGFSIVLRRPAANGRPERPGGPVTVELKEQPLLFAIELHFSRRPRYAIRQDLRSAGWRWAEPSRCWYIEDTAASREHAAGILAGIEPPPEKPAANVEPTGNNAAGQNLAKKLQNLADGMESMINAKLNSATSQQRPTARRLAMAESMRKDGGRLQAVQALLRNLAGLHAAGTCPPALAGISSRKAAEAALFSWRESERIPAAVELATVTSEPETDQARKIKALKNKIFGARFAGYFVTPPAVVEKMISLAAMDPGHRVLEPSAGSGNIADQVRAAGASVDCIEIVPALREILEAGGHTVIADDFLDFSGGDYDRIIMNPPFENGADMEHIMHAFNDCLAPGGRLVSVISESPFFRQDRKAVEFRAWLENAGGYSEKLPEKSFYNTETPTGVNTRLVIIDK